MQENLKAYRIWKTMKPPALRRLALAVFLLFGVVGPLNTLMESHIRIVPWQFLAVQTVACGGMAASIVLFGRKKWWITMLLVAGWTGVIVMNSGALSFVFDEHGVRVELGGFRKPLPGAASTTTLTLTPEDLDAIYSQRAGMGAVALALLVSGYSVFIRVISRELRQRAQLETEISLAREIQQSLLPSTTVRTPRVEVSGMTFPASEVGGDLFDIIELPGGAVAVAIADVTGHGVGAGILSAMTKSALRSQIQHDPDPRQVVHNLNDTIVQVSTEKMFVTFAYLLVDPSADAVKYVTAGHPPILLRRKDAGEIQQCRTVNLGLGMKERAQFATGEFPLSSGDAVLLYTDGILEASNGHGEQFGADRLNHSFLKSPGSCREVCNSVISDATGFAGERQPADDISVVCVRFR